MIRAFAILFVLSFVVTNEAHARFTLRLIAGGSTSSASVTPFDLNQNPTGLSGETEQSVRDLTPFINLANDEFEMIVDYQDGDGTINFLGSSSGRVGLGILTVTLVGTDANGAATRTLSFLSGQEIPGATDLFGWDTGLANLLVNQPNQFNFGLNNPQNAGAILKFAPQNGSTLIGFTPNQIVFEGEWNTSDPNNETFSISSLTPNVVPEPSTATLVALFAGSWIGCGRRSRVRAR